MVKEFGSKKGFTLVELLVAFTILSIMGVIMIGVLNPVALVNKAQDSRRKNDLKEIKIAFEKYYTDKGFYPAWADVSNWNLVDNCGKNIPEVRSYFKVWPCGPNNEIYKIDILNKDTFKVTTKLDNRKDKDIPVGWYEKNTYSAYVGRKEEVNYGVSSPNILWYESNVVNRDCLGLDCIRKVGEDTPTLVDVCNTGGGIQCYRGSARPGCEVHSCNR